MMAYTKDNLQRLFQSKFNLLKWQMMMKEYFRADKVRIQPEALDEDAEERKGCFLGSTTTKDGYKMGFFYYNMEDGSVLRRKVGLRNLIRPYLGYGFDAALAVFDDGINWRLSLICDLKGDAEATSAKRFTYVFGDEKAYYKTPVSRFFDLQKRADEYLEIKNAFSVEALSDDFFDEYRKQYAEFVKFLTGKVYVKKGKKWVEQEVGEPDAQFFTSFGEDEKMVRDYIKKMMGRIVFLYFLQSKGWLGGNLHYMHDLFYGADDAVKEDFLDKVLEPMFFGLLNTKPEDRSTAPLVNGVGVKYIPHAEAIPYLNGGLFQQEQIDEVDSCFPAEMFKSLFDFFDSYNFTIDENDPNDAEVGVDPEMLGKIFENLLEDNKDKGAFYTPKEIVRYMCQESLIAYLQTDVEDEEKKKCIANFVKTNDVEELGGASSNLAISIDQKLKDVKICDPAIGSGAFPMGLLRELYSCRKAIEVWDADNAADIKRHIIQNNIYGVDIEKGAVDIARLRFWLALIIDEKEPMPLPNLDFKIMQGNSLLESFMGVDLNMTSKKVKTGRDTKKTRGVLSLGFEENDVQKTIQDLVKSYFSITDHTLRAQRRKEIDKYVKDYIKICAEGNKEVQDAVDELEIPNDQFFLWHTYFADVFEQGGFDIVIGNPPYIRVQTINDKMPELASVYKTQYADVAIGNFDLYILFIWFGYKLLNNNGYLSYIQPNKFFLAVMGQKLRYLLKHNMALYKILDFGTNQIFNNATTYTCILFLTKNQRHEFLYKTFNLGEYSRFLEGIEFGKMCVDDLPDNGNWLFKENASNTLISKIKDNGTLFSDLVTRIFKGSSTGNDKVFLLDLISESAEFYIVSSDVNDEYFKIEKEICRKFIYGESVLRYSEPSPYRLLLFPYVKHNEKYALMDIGYLRTNYPNAYEYLMKNKSVLMKRKVALSDDTFYKYSAARSLNEYEKEKILIPDMLVSNRISFDQYGQYFTGPAIHCPVFKEDINQRYYLGVLNSKLFWYYISNTSTALRGNAYRLTPEYLNDFAFPSITNEQRKSVITLVDNVLELKKKQADTTSLENKIDFLVYHLYGLTYDEVLIVDPDTPITREEYEAYEGE
mgnify:FL=1